MIITTSFTFSLLEKTYAKVFLLESTEVRNGTKLVKMGAWRPEREMKEWDHG